MSNRTSGSNLTDPPLIPEPHASMVVRLTLYALVFLLTVLGNLLVIAVIMKNRKLRSLDTYYYGYYLLSLAIADLCFGLLTIPITVIYTETGSWPFGAFVCKLFGTVPVVMLSASILTLVVLTFERYWAIVYPLKPRLTKNKLLFILVMVWFVSFAAGSPELYAYQLRESVSGSQIQKKYPCAEVWSKRQRQGYTIFLFLFTYVVPLILILGAYIRIVFELKHSKAQCFGSNERTHIKKTVRVLIVVVTSFALCFLPEKVFFLWIDFGDGGKYPHIDSLMKYSYLIFSFNSCLNPIIYGAVDINFRNFYRSVVRQCAGCKEYSSEIKRRLSVGRHSTRQGDYDLTSDACDV